jgi:hypothetical protein
MALLPTIRMATDIYKSTLSPGFLLAHTIGQSASGHACQKLIGRW